MDDYVINKNVLVVGCGGLGCFIVEGLLRMNVKKIVVCDPDKFSLSNINRQLYCDKTTIGEYKVEVARQRSISLGYQGDFIAYNKLFEPFMLEDIDVVIDGLDNIKDRLILEELCAKKNIPLIHGAVEGNSYQVGICMPNSNMLHKIYKDVKEPKEKHTNYLAVSLCASKQVKLALKEPEEYFEVGEI